MSLGAVRAVTRPRGGVPLVPGVRDTLERRMGRDFGHVRTHQDTAASEMAVELGARAFTHKNHIWLGRGESPANLRLMAHEVTHVVQQGTMGRRVQRYEAGEHARLGETQHELLNSFQETHGIIEEPDDAVREAIKEKSPKIMISGVEVDYGIGIAMGDFFATPDKMNKASPETIKKLAELIERERKTGVPVEQKEWTDVLGNDYLKLVEKNVEHFAPSFTSGESAGVSEVDHKSAWEKYHKDALLAPLHGDKRRGMMINAFADHFLTDAFAAGHLINKLDAMNAYKGHKMADTVIPEIARQAFTELVKSKLSGYTASDGGPVDSASRLAELLKAVDYLDSTVLANADVLAVHDELNGLSAPGDSPSGLSVENEKGDKWMLSGDGTLNADTLQIARRAVAQSQLNVLSMINAGPIKPNFKALFKQVWDYTPSPSHEGQKHLKGIVDRGVNPNSPEFASAIATQINKHITTLIDKLADAGLLKLRQ
jgi:hypothetical protein